MARIAAALAACAMLATESEAFSSGFPSLRLGASPRTASSQGQPGALACSLAPGRRSRGSSGPLGFSMADPGEKDVLGRRELLQMGPGLLALSGLMASPIPAFAEEATKKKENVDLVKLADEWKGFQEKRTFKRAGRDIEIEQRFSEKRKNGLAVYEGNEVLTDYMVSLGKDYWKGKSVLELGCGTGFGSITAFCMGAQTVTATDRDPVVLDLAAANFKRNIKADEMQGDRDLRTRRLKWGSPRCEAGETNKKELGMCYADLESKSSFRPAGADKETVDVVIGADLTYSADLVPFIVNTIQRVSHPKTEVLFVWCEPALFTWNTDVMEQLNEGLKLFGDYFNVEKITSGKVLEGHDNTFIVRMTMKA